MTTRRAFLGTLAGTLFAGPLAAGGQQAASRPWARRGWIVELPDVTHVHVRSGPFQFRRESKLLAFSRDASAPKAGTFHGLLAEREIKDTHLARAQLALRT